MAAGGAIWRAALALGCAAGLSGQALAAPPILSSAPDLPPAAALEASEAAGEEVAAEAEEAAGKKKRKGKDAKTLEEKKERSFDMEVGMRLRRMTIPQGLLDIWFFSAETAPTWPLPGQDRPKIGGWAYGLEWVFRDNRTSGIIWVDWIDSSMEEGYWDDVDDDGSAVDGDWLRPTPNFGLLSFGGDYQYEIPMVKPGNTRGVFGMSMVVGGGLGVAVKIGSLERWVASDDDVPSFELLAQGVPANADDKKIPPVFPMVDFNLGLQLLFGERLVIRLEGGLHTMLYYGASAGMRF